jgi:hypothetical protein
MIVEFPEEVSLEDVLDVLRPCGWAVEQDSSTGRVKAVPMVREKHGCAMCGNRASVLLSDGRELCSACFLTTYRKGRL